MENEGLVFKTEAVYRVNSNNYSSVIVSVIATIFNGKTYYRITQIDDKKIYGESLLVSKNLVSSGYLKDYSHSFSHEKRTYCLQID